MKIEIPYDSENSILDICTKKMKMPIQKDMYTSILTAALFTIAKMQKQPESLWMDEWTKKRWYVCTHVCGNIQFSRSVVSDSLRPHE